MPLQRCEIDGGPGWKWGDAGACYGYTAGDDASEQSARDKAMKQAAAMGEFPGTGQNRSANQPEVFYRSGTFVTDDVSFKDRMIDVMAAPWDEPAQVSWRGQTWREIFLRGAFDEAVNNAVRIPVNREHVYGDTVGRVVRLRNADNGLLATVKVARPPAVTTRSSSPPKGSSVHPSVGLHRKCPTSFSISVRWCGGCAAPSSNIWRWWRSPRSEALTRFRFTMTSRHTRRLGCSRW
jgi:hypothetical protein